MIFHCGDCNAPFLAGIDVCQDCGSVDVRMATYTDKGTRVSIPAGPSEFRLTGKNHEAVKGRFLRTTIKWEWSSSRAQWEHVERIFDRLNGTYTETYYDSITREVTYRKSGPITEQSLHGRRRKRAA